MVLRWALSIAAVIRGAGVSCASETLLRSHRTANTNEIPLWLLELISFVLLILELTSLQAGTAVNLTRSHILTEAVNCRLPHGLKPAFLLALCGAEKVVALSRPIDGFSISIKNSAGDRSSFT
jgi:hypothetical protein